MNKSLLIGFILLVLMGCEKDLIETQQLKGTWVESEFKSDTIVFGNMPEMLTLNRGKELRDSFLLPIYHSGPYTYQIDNDSINIRWGLSSTLVTSKYYFEFDNKNDRIKIGNFFIDSLSSNKILVFYKAD
jgi:hypothetical protein